ncbi:hypothetical protein KKF97_05510 [Myxococcota bacterium]|nr:hypothetical protein [Myxococcota bacterium]MBU1381982.1 hypothetical protein [Myxococcota bacterium]
MTTILNFYDRHKEKNTYTVDGVIWNLFKFEKDDIFLTKKNLKKIGLDINNNDINIILNEVNTIDVNGHNSLHKLALNILIIFSLKELDIKKEVFHSILLYLKNLKNHFEKLKRIAGFYNLDCFDYENEFIKIHDMGMLEKYFIILLYCIDTKSSDNTFTPMINNIIYSRDSVFSHIERLLLFLHKLSLSHDDNYKKYRDFYLEYFEEGLWENFIEINEYSLYSELLRSFYLRKSLELPFPI